MVEIQRRRLLTGLVSLIAAPAIVRAASLMPIKVYIENPYTSFLGDYELFEIREVAIGYAITRQAIDDNLYRGVFGDFPT